MDVMVQRCARLDVHRDNVVGTVRVPGTARRRVDRINDPDQLAELAKARTRQKIPQLREALASRFQIEHHGVMVAQLLAHIDAIDNLSDRITAVLTPHEDLIDLLWTIPGIQSTPPRS